MSNRLLLVEDDARVSDFLVRGLSAEGYRVSAVKSGEAALDFARGEDLEIAIFDVMLPGITGIEVCQVLRAERWSVPVLMLTAMDAVQDRVQGLRCGADDYLTKPFAFEELLARLEALLRRPPAISASVVTIQIADLVFNRERMEAHRGGKRLILTAKELALLELFMTSPGRLFSRERILANVWGSYENPLTNVVDVYIRRLRARIDDGHNLALIKTVRGLGYRLDDSPE